MSIIWHRFILGITGMDMSKRQLMPIVYRSSWTFQQQQRSCPNVNHSPTFASTGARTSYEGRVPRLKYDGQTNKANVGVSDLRVLNFEVD